MTPDEVKALRALAEQAQRRPWALDEDRHRLVGLKGASDTLCQRRLPWSVDAAYLAALSPERVIGLLDAMERAPRDAARITSERVACALSRSTSARSRAVSPDEAGQRAAQAEADRAVAERVLLERCDGHVVMLPVQTARAILWGVEQLQDAEVERMRDLIRVLAGDDKERDMRDVPG